MGNQHPLNEKKGGLRSPTIRKLAKDGKTWTPTEQVTRDKCLKQFCKAGRKGVEVTSGNSEAYKRGWALMFGTPEEKARAQAEIEAEKVCGDPVAERVDPGSVYFPDGVPDFIIDPTLPPDTIEIRSPDGKRGYIVNLGSGE